MTDGEGIEIAHLEIDLVGTSRCDVPAGAERAERKSKAHMESCAAGRGADGAARRPYQEPRIRPVERELNNEHDG